MLVREAIREAIRGLGFRSLALLVVTIGATGWLAAAESDAVFAAIRADLDAQRAGVQVWEVAADDDAGLSAETCDGLRHTLGVHESGGLRRDDVGDGFVLRVAGTPIPVLGVTPRAVNVWWPEVPDVTGTLLAGAETLARGTVTVGSEITTAVGRVPVGVVGIAVPAEVPNELLASKVLQPGAASREVSVCWFRTSRGAWSAGASIAVAAFGTDGLSIRPYDRPDRYGRTPLEAFRADPQRGQWMVAVGLLGMTAAVLARTRRREMALYRTLGCSGIDLLVVNQCEVLLVVAVGTAVGALSGLAWSAQFADLRLVEPDMYTAVRPAVLAGCAAAAICPWLTLVIGSGRRFADLRTH